MKQATMSVRWDGSVRPVVVCVSISVIAEAILFATFGLHPGTSGFLLSKFLWAVVVCGLGMGLVLGILAARFVRRRWRGYAAVWVLALLSVLLLGVACNGLCFLVDLQVNWFGASQHPLAWIGSGVLGAFAGGWLGGWILFVKKPRKTQLGQMER